jgi:hypothetical protein
MHIEEHKEGCLSFGLPFLHLVTTLPGLQVGRQIVTDNLKIIVMFMSGASFEEPANSMYPSDEREWAGGGKEFNPSNCQ